MTENQILLHCEKPLFEIFHLLAFLLIVAKSQRETLDEFQRFVLNSSAIPQRTHHRQAIIRLDDIRRSGIIEFFGVRC